MFGCQHFLNFSSRGSKRKMCHLDVRIPRCHGFGWCEMEFLALQNFPILKFQMLLARRDREIWRKKLLGSVWLSYIHEFCLQIRANLELQCLVVGENSFDYFAFKRLSPPSSFLKIHDNVNLRIYITMDMRIDISVDLWIHISVEFIRLPNASFREFKILLI